MPGVDRYAGLEVALDKLIELLVAEFGASLHAVWVGGSLALGHFDGRQSDIDVAAVLSPRPTWRRLAPRLSTFHEGLVESGDEWLKRVELFYYGPGDLRPWRARRTHLRVPAVEAGRATPVPEEVGPEIALYQHVLREHGLRLLGPAPSDLIGRVPGTALRAGCRWVVDRWVTGWLREPEQLEPVDFRSFAALTCCRLLSTLMTGGVASKPVAAKWAASVLDEGLARVALAALAVSETEMGDPLTIEDTQALIWRTLHSFGISRL